MFTTTIPADTTGVDPTAAPEDVLDKQIFEVPTFVRQTDAPVRFLLLTAEGVASLTVEFFALIQETTDPFEPLPTPADRLYRQIGDPITVNNTDLGLLALTKGASLFAIPPPSGKIYARITAGATAGAKLHMAFEGG